MVRLFLATLAACSDGDPTTTQTPTTTEGVIDCAQPELREESWYDSQSISAEGVPEDRRFWGGGIIAADFDGDGDPDLLVPGPWTARYLRNDGGGVFVDDDAMLPDVDYLFSAGGAAADYDADGDMDAIITRWGPPDILLRNEGGMLVVADLPTVLDAHSQSAAWGDFDLDGDLDLVISGHGQAEVYNNTLQIDQPGDPTRLFLGDGTGGFEDRSDLLPTVTKNAYSFVWGPTEFNGDGLPDFVIANDYTSWSPGMAVASRAKGELWVREDAQHGLTVQGPGMGLAIGDVNGDGWDEYVQPIWGKVIYLRSTAAGVWVEASQSDGVEFQQWKDGIPAVAWGADFADLDHDADLDLLVATGHLDTIADYTGGGDVGLSNLENTEIYPFLNGGTGAFAEDRTIGLQTPGTWRGFVVTDLNGDGWQDVARHDLEGPIVIDLARCGDAAWLRVLPRPLHRAVGARVTVRAGSESWTHRVFAGGTNLNSAGPPEVHFGLGERDAVDEVEIAWPDGEVETLSGPIATRQVLTIGG
jgi:enediyne biosynthesis protein E4